MKSKKHTGQEPCYEDYAALLGRYEWYLQWLGDVFYPGDLRLREMLVHELSLALYGIITSADDSASVTDRYLRRAWMNHAINFAKRRKATTTHALPISEALELADHEVQLALERKELVEEVLASLNTGDRRYMEAYLATGSNKEAASLLGVTPNSFTVRYHRIVARLKKKFNPTN